MAAPTSVTMPPPPCHPHPHPYVPGAAQAFSYPLQVHPARKCAFSFYSSTTLMGVLSDPGPKGRPVANVHFYLFTTFFVAVTYVCTYTHRHLHSYPQPHTPQPPSHTHTRTHAHPRPSLTGVLATCVGVRTVCRYANVQRRLPQISSAYSRPGSCVVLVLALRVTGMGWR